jgi:hypothetical protein
MSQMSCMSQKASANAVDDFSNVKLAAASWLVIMKEIGAPRVGSTLGTSIRSLTVLALHSAHLCSVLVSRTLRLTRDGDLLPHRFGLRGLFKLASGFSMARTNWSSLL